MKDTNFDNKRLHGQCIQMAPVLHSSQESLFIMHDAQNCLHMIQPIFTTTIILQQNIYTNLRVYFCTVHDLHGFYEMLRTRMNKEVNKTTI